jgi:hypothetical protein
MVRFISIYAKNLFSCCRHFGISERRQGVVPVVRKALAHDSREVGFIVFFVSLASANFSTKHVCFIIVCSVQILAGRAALHSEAVNSFKCS